jgi:2-polyprenyl-6-methoxyphenol hydroxylase-like FAD-dependent oxidoreductase
MQPTSGELEGSNELPRRTEVLVVGAGPIGLAIAASLVGHGHDVTVLDRQAVGANTSRAAVVHARTLELLERIGVADRLADLGIHAQFSVRDGDRTLVPVRFD